MKTLKYSEIHLLAAVWNIYAVYARILEILDQNKYKKIAGCNGLTLNWINFSKIEKYLYVHTYTQYSIIAMGGNKSKYWLKKMVFKSVKFTNKLVIAFIWQK